MAAESIIFTIFWSFIAFSLLLCGASIYRGNIEMIAGFYRRYDPNKIADKEGLTKWVGSNLIFMGICTLIFSISSYFVQTYIGWLWLLSFLIICARLANGGKEYEKMENASCHDKKDKYHCEEYGFSVYYPNGWVLQTQGLPDILRFYHIQVMFCDPLRAENCVNVAACRIFRERSIEELKAVPIMYAKIFGGRILSLKRTKVNNVDAIKATYKLQKQTQKQVIFDKGSYGYVFTFGAPSNKFKDCKPIFDECLQSFKFEHITDDAGTHYFSGVSYQQRGLYKDAEKEYLKAIELDPDYYKAYCNLGAICMKTQRGEEAEKYYKKALQINPKDPITLLNIGSIYFADEASEDEGLKYFSKAIIADSAVEPAVHQKIHTYSYYPKKDIQKLNKLVNEET